MPSIRQNAAIAQLVCDLQGVLKRMFMSEFSNAGNTLEHGLQNDDHSCGVCTINAIDHALFGTALFIPRMRRVLRCQYFKRLVVPHLQMVCEWSATPVHCEVLTIFT